MPVSSNHREDLSVMLFMSLSAKDLPPHCLSGIHGPFEHTAHQTEAFNLWLGRLDSRNFKLNTKLHLPYLLYKISFEGEKGQDG